MERLLKALPSVGNWGQMSTVEGGERSLALESKFWQCVGNWGQMRLLPVLKLCNRVLLSAIVYYSTVFLQFAAHSMFTWFYFIGHDCFWFWSFISRGLVDKSFILLESYCEALLQNLRVGRGSSEQQCITQLPCGGCIFGRGINIPFFWYTLQDWTLEC